MTPAPSEPTHRPAPPLLIGWKERLDFPEWGLRRVRVKIDTGAHTSAIGATECELAPVDGRMVARLRLALNRRRPEQIVQVEAPVLRMVHVTNTGGFREERPLIEAAIRLGPVEKRIRLTITRREGLRFPMILGREALAGCFVVDAARIYVLPKG
ncbi:MAG TPA: RimK/LysX family protein [Gemmataceae bacterium]|nr:RimK/LysX family protein [Gemmataceae bacterium]